METENRNTKRKKEVGQIQQFRKGNRRPEYKKRIQRMKNKFKIKDKDLMCYHIWPKI